MEAGRIIGRNLLRSGVLAFAFCEISVHASGRDNFKMLVRVSSPPRNSIHILNLLFLALNSYFGVNYCMALVQKPKLT